MVFAMSRLVGYFIISTANFMESIGSFLSIVILISAFFSFALASFPFVKNQSWYESYSYKSGYILSKLAKYT